MNYNSWRNSHYEIEGSTENLQIEIKYSFNKGCRRSCFENIFLTDNLNVTINHLSWIYGKEYLHKWRGSGNFWKIIRQKFDK